MKSEHASEGFTLVEMLVSVAIVVLLLAILLSIIDATRQTWSFTRGKVEAFQDAREAFEAITRGLSQATLNTYWDYNSPTNPTQYERQSELRFVSGDAATLLGSVNDSGGPIQTVTHAAFFQAPLGFVGNPAYRNLKNLLNTWGYFIQFGSDESFRPAFINGLSNAPSPHYRFRVMELMEPSDALTLYQYSNGRTVYGSGTNGYTSSTWFTTPLNNWFGQAAPSLTGTGATVRVLADNIVALVLLPKLAPADLARLNSSSTGTVYTDASLVSSDSPGNYLYDSTGGVAMGSNVKDPNIDPTNQLPPVIQVTLVAVDEATYSRFESTQQDKTVIPSSLGLADLFKTVGSTTDATAAGYAQDLQTLQNTLQANKINYRVYSTNVSIKAAKWSRSQ